MKKLFFAFCCILLISAGRAQEISFTAQTMPDRVSFAQPFDASFEIAYTPGYILELDRDALPEGFELTRSEKRPLSPGTAAYDVTLMPFTLGPSTFTVTFLLKDQEGGRRLAQASSDTKTLSVQPVQYFKEKTLRDIRPPYIPSNRLIWLLCALVLALIVYFARRWWRDVREDRVLLRAERDTRPADIIALSKIQILLQSGLWEKAEYKLFYSELDAILREYFWRRFGLDVSSDTSAELLRRARNVKELGPLLAALKEYVQSSDLVKFARLIPPAELMRRDVHNVQTLVKQTAPRPAETKEEK